MSIDQIVLYMIDLDYGRDISSNRTKTYMHVKQIMRHENPSLDDKDICHLALELTDKAYTIYKSLIYDI